MAITEQDIKLIKSARMTDTPDGGGRMTGNVVQSGVDNNIFDDVSNLDRVYGSASLRKVFGTVQTLDTEKYLGARVVIDEAPADPNVHCLLFGASSTFDRRADVSAKVESYLALGAAYGGLLYGNHLAGMSTVILIQRVELSLPATGAVLALRKDPGVPTEVVQYVRITGVSAETRTFTDGAGDFQRAVVVCSISDPLRTSFTGFGAPRIDSDIDYTNRAQVFETIVADASQYFGIRPLAEAAGPGDFSIKADSIFSPLLPSAQIETPIPDARTNGVAAALAAAGPMLSQNITLNFSPTQRMFIGGGVMPGSVFVSRDGVVLSDQGGVLKNGAADVGAVDYANGILSLSTAVWSGAGTHVVEYGPAAQVDAVSATLSLPINVSTRGLSHTATLYPVPAPGSLTVSYMSFGRWYVLRDDGSGALRGATSALGAGMLNRESGTFAVTLGALPDVGSAIVLQWAESQQMLPPADVQRSFGGRLYLAINSDGLLSEVPGSKAFEPGSVVVSWNDGTARTATDNGMGEFTGAATGYVDYARGVLRISPAVLPPVGTVFSVVHSGMARGMTTPSPVSLFGGSVGTNIRPHSVSLPVQVTVSCTAPYASAVDGSPKTKTVTAIDDGVGNLVVSDAPNPNVVVGTINYTTGVVNLLTNPSGVGQVDNDGCTVSAYSGSAAAGFYTAPTVIYSGPAIASSSR